MALLLFCSKKISITSASIRIKTKEDGKSIRYGCKNYTGEGKMDWTYLKY